MSTRSTLWYDDEPGGQLHLYEDGFDHDGVYIDGWRHYLTEDNAGATVLRIPLRLWKEMRKYTIEPAERYLDMTDEELRAEAEQRVDEHRAWLEEHKDSWGYSLVGSIVFGRPESTRDEMVESYIHWYKEDVPIDGDGDTATSE